jgi:magnesium-transporting ATPase (P-type)
MNILTLILAAIPTSLLALRIIDKNFSKHNPQLSKITTICTDVLGTLTDKKLEVKELDFNDDQSLKLAATASILCHYQKQEKIENLINSYFKSQEIPQTSLKNIHQIIQKIPSEQKKISTIVSKNINTQEIFSFSKGHPEKIIERCTRIQVGNKKEELNASDRNKLKNKVKKMNEEGLKVIAFAYKGLPLKQLDNYSENFAENDLVFLGVVGLGHSLHKDLKSQIEKLKNLGIKIYILANVRDRKAVSAGRELGIFNPQYFEVISHEDLKSIKDKKLEKILANKKKDYIFTFLNPNDKKRIFQILKKQGEKIAEINQKNKINFKKIINSIEQEKSLKGNKKKIILHAITSKASLFLLILISIILKVPPILSIPLILIIDLLINLPLELAIRNKIASKNKLIIYHGISISILLIFLYLFTLIRYGYNLGDSFEKTESLHKISTNTIFSAIIFIQIFFAFSISKLFKNFRLIATSIIIMLLLYLTTNFEPFITYLNLIPLNRLDLYLILFIILLMTSVKFIIHKNESKNT